MNKQNIEESIRRSIAFDTPDLFDKIASAPVTKLPEEDYIVKNQPKRSTSKLYAFYTACTSFAIVFAICFGLARNYYAVDSIIAIDVNPSVEISLNKSDKVLSVKANNEDGKTLIKDKDFRKKSYDVVVSDLTESLSSKGYIDQKHNSILVSVSNSNETKAEKVKTQVISDIKTTLNKKEIEPVIYNQSITDSNAKKLERLAKKYNISFGKMKLINSLIEKDSSLTIEELAKLPINQIPDYVEEREIQLAEVISCDIGTTAVASTEKGTTKKEPTPNVIPKPEGTTKADATTDNRTESTTATQETTTSSAPITSETTTSANISESTTTLDTSIGVVIPKTECLYCSDSCQCPYCKEGCKKDCPYCDMDCPNYKFDVSIDSNQTTEDSSANTEENSGYEITEPDDIGISGSTSYPEDEDIDTPTIPSDDTETSDEIEEDDDITVSKEGSTVTTEDTLGFTAETYK